MIIDTNTSIMDEAFIGQIEKYVREGGMFITFTTSGRHLPALPNTWPISRLTGYDVLSVEHFNAEGETDRSAAPGPGATPAGLTVSPAASQSIYTKSDAWMASPWLNGLRMKKHLPDTQDLLLWKDGTVAVGMRKIGKGAIIEFGCKAQGAGLLGIDLEAFRPIFESVGLKTNTVEVKIDDPKAEFLRGYLYRNFVSNNGLFDVTSVWNMNRANAVKATLTFKENNPTVARDVVTGQKLPITDGKLADVPLKPMETRVFLTPRNRIAEAAAAWFDLQRQWWKATVPVTKPFPKVSDRFSFKIDENWSFHPLGEKEDPLPMVTATFDDSSWTKLPLGSWSRTRNGRTYTTRCSGAHSRYRRNGTRAAWNSGSIVGLPFTNPAKYGWMVKWSSPCGPTVRSMGWL